MRERCECRRCLTFSSHQNIDSASRGAGCGSGTEHASFGPETDGAVSVRGSVSVLAACLAVAIAADCRAQPAPADGGPVRPPLLPEPGDVWAEVRAWTAPRAVQLPRPNTANAPRPASVSPTARVDAPRGSAAAGSAGPVPSAPEAAGASRTVVTNASRRSNIRAAPDLGAPVARSVPQTSVLNVFGRGPEGWLSVGDDQPFGWIHRSALRP
jgi:hypothetical protein